MLQIYGSNRTGHRDVHLLTTCVEANSYSPHQWLNINWLESELDSGTSLNEEDRCTFAGVEDVFTELFLKRKKCKLGS